MAKSTARFFQSRARKQAVPKPGRRWTFGFSLPRPLSSVFCLLSPVFCLLVLAAATAYAALPIRGIVVDPARLPESPEYYRRLVDFAADWGLNTILFRLADDQGAALRFDRHPELITHRNALTKQEARDLAMYAQERGVQLIPEMESFGHAGYLTRSSRWAYLADRNTTTLTPNHPDSLALLRDLYTEVAETFPAAYLHGGCDEVAWSGSSGPNAAEVWARHVNSLEQIARSLDKELIVWGDHALRRDPAILQWLSRSIILIDWDYSVTEPAAVRRYAQTALDRGFRVIGGPAANWCRWGPRVGSAQLRNIDVFADMYRAIDNPANLGIITTNWVPTRYLQNAIWDTLAYAAVATTNGPAAAQSRALPMFVERHYGAEWSQTWEELFGLYYQIAPTRPNCGASSPSVFLLPWDSNDALVNAILSPRRPSPPFEALLDLMARVGPTVTRNAEDFAAFRLSVEYLRHSFWRTDVLAAEAEKLARAGNAQPLFARIASEDLFLLERLREDWDRGRPPDSPVRDRAMPGYTSYDLLLAQFNTAAAYSMQLATTPGAVAAVLAQAGLLIRVAPDK